MCAKAPSLPRDVRRECLKPFSSLLPLFITTCLTISLWLHCCPLAQKEPSFGCLLVSTRNSFLCTQLRVAARRVSSPGVALLPSRRSALLARSNGDVERVARDLPGSSHESRRGFSFARLGEVSNDEDRLLSGFAPQSNYRSSPRRLAITGFNFTLRISEVVDNNFNGQCKSVRSHL